MREKGCRRCNERDRERGIPSDAIKTLRERERREKGVDEERERERGG